MLHGPAIDIQSTRMYYLTIYESVYGSGYREQIYQNCTHSYNIGKQGGEKKSAGQSKASPHTRGHPVSSHVEDYGDRTYRTRKLSCSSATRTASALINPWWDQECALRFLWQAAVQVDRHLQKQRHLLLQKQGNSNVTSSAGAGKFVAGVVVAVVDGKATSVFPDNNIQKRLGSVRTARSARPSMESGADSLEPPQSACNSDDVLSVVSRYSSVPCQVQVFVAALLLMYTVRNIDTYMMSWHKSS